MTAPLMIGRILGNKYQLIEEIEASEKVRVYHALKIDDESKVIVKTLQPRWLWDRNLVTRYTREIQAMAALKHPALIRILDVNYENKIFFVATEFAEGRDAFSIIRDKISLPLTDILDIIITLARFLIYAVESGTKYRTIKMSNIIISPSGKAKVLSFNVPRSVLTRNIKGLKPNTSEDPDIFFLGVLLYQFLALRFPLDRPDRIITDLAMLRLIKLSADWSLNGVPSLDPLDKEGLEAIILRAVTFDIKARYPSLNAMLIDLISFTEKRIRRRGENVDMSSASNIIDAIFSPELAEEKGKSQGELGSLGSLAPLEQEKERDFWKKPGKKPTPTKGPIVGRMDEESSSQWGMAIAIIFGILAIVAIVMLSW